MARPPGHALGTWRMLMDILNMAITCPHDGHTVGSHWAHSVLKGPSICLNDLLPCGGNAPFVTSMS